MAEMTFGWHKDPWDDKDYLHKRGVTPLPERSNNRHLLTAIRKQLASSCVGYGVGINLNSVKVKLGIYTEWCSPNYIYNGARALEGTLPFDNGCYPKDALEWTLKHGILLEHYWPDVGFDKAAPSSERMSKADKYKGFAYYRCVDGVDGICDALSSGYFVSIGSPWFREWYETDSCGRLSKPTSSSFEVGGHETCFIDYDLRDGIFYGANSWGTSWGDKGCYIMPFEAIDEFKKRQGYDAHYIAFEKDQLPNSPDQPCILTSLLRNMINGEINKSV